MRPNEYQKEALRTEHGMNKKYPRELNCILGIIGETGECIDIYKKHMFQNHPFDMEHIIKEMGDVCWYLAVLADAVDIPLEQCVISTHFQYKPETEKIIDEIRIQRSLSNFFMLYETVFNLTSKVNEYSSAKRLCKTAEITEHERKELEPTFKKRIDKIIDYIEKALKILLETACMFGYSLEEVCMKNIEKLRARYPEGFDTERSLHRKEGDI